MRDGILVLYKPREWTSSDCVAICRRALGVKGIKKVGHGGTLDPMATGVLPIYVGQATRIMEYMDLDYKTYRCQARLGLVTDTLDIWGEILSEKPLQEALHKGYEDEITEDMVRESLMSFEGHIEQIPPKYSAVRINGKRLYEYAYKGQELDVEVKPRKVHIKELSIEDIDLEERTLTFSVTCSKGTYIRSLCSDLGEKLGCGCTMTGLERTAVGIISLESVADRIISAAEVKAMVEDVRASSAAESAKQADASAKAEMQEAWDRVADRLENLLIPPDYPLVNLGEVSINEDRTSFFSRGGAIRWNQVRVEKEPDVEALRESGRSGETGSIPCNARGRSYEFIYKVYQQETREFLGIGYYDEAAGEMKADKVFIEQR